MWFGGEGLPAGGDLPAAVCGWLLRRVVLRPDVGGFLMRSDVVQMDEATRVDMAFVLDVVMGMLACGDVGGVPIAGASPDVLTAAAVDAWQVAAGGDEWGDVPTVRSHVVEALVLDGLARVVPADEVLASILAALDGLRRGVLPPLPGWSARWACPYCSDELAGRFVRLVHDGDGFACPVCGCHTTSPADDACLVVGDGVDDDGTAAGSPCLPCAWLFLGGAGLSPSALVGRSANEWAAAAVCDEGGDLPGSLRHTVRGEVFEALAMGRSVDELPARVASVVEDWAAARGDLPGVADALFACQFGEAGCEACCARWLR